MRTHADFLHDWHGLRSTQPTRSGLRRGGPIVSGTGYSGNSEVLAKSKRTHPTGV